MAFGTEEKNVNGVALDGQLPNTVWESDMNDKQREIMEEVSANTVRDLFRNMTAREQREAVKGCSTDILMAEITRRQKKQAKQLADVRKALR